MRSLLIGLLAAVAGAGVLSKLDVKISGVGSTTVDLVVAVNASKTDGQCGQRRERTLPGCSGSFCPDNGVTTKAITVVCSAYPDPTMGSPGVFAPVDNGGPLRRHLLASTVQCDQTTISGTANSTLEDTFDISKGGYHEFEFSFSGLEAGAPYTFICSYTDSQCCDFVDVFTAPAGLSVAVEGLCPIIPGDGLVTECTVKAEEKDIGTDFPGPVTVDGIVYTPALWFSLDRVQSLQGFTGGALPGGSISPNFLSTKFCGLNPLLPFKLWRVVGQTFIPVSDDCPAEVNALGQPSWAGDCATWRVCHTSDYFGASGPTSAPTSAPSNETQTKPKNKPDKKAKEKAPKKEAKEDAKGKPKKPPAPKDDPKQKGKKALALGIGIGAGALIVSVSSIVLLKRRCGRKQKKQQSDRQHGTAPTTSVVEI